MTLPNIFAGCFTSSFTPFTELQKVIAGRTQYRNIKYFSDRRPEIIAPIEEIAHAVESAYILTAKTDLPKVTKVDDHSRLGLGRTYYFDGKTITAASTGYKPTSAYARTHAAQWLAIALDLEAEEKAKTYEEAKTKAVADAAAKAAKQARLDDISHLHFGRDYADLGANKASAVNEIHRLETIINEDNPKEDAA